MTRPPVLLLFAALALAAPAAAEPPAADEAAVGLHERATEAYRAGRRDLAVELWRQAFELSPSWKYAYNAANTLYERSRFSAAWTYLDRAQELGMPAQHLDRLTELRSKVAAELLVANAFITLTVEPEDAGVTIDGAPWPAPRSLWTPNASSRIRVTREGHHPAELVWDHPTGTQSARTVRLEPLPPRGALLVQGTPLGATVTVDGAVAGQLPLAPLPLPPGPHDVGVSHGGYEPAVRLVTVDGGLQTDVTVDLVAELPPPPPTSLAPAGWATLGAGLGAAGAGVGLLLWSKELTTDLEDLNAGRGLAGASYDEYASRYDETRRRYDAARIAGAVLTGAGAAAAATGVVLLALDETRTGAPDVGFAPLTGGAAIFGTVTF
jgi:tetratricopeptide (TPR) repeat protein